MPDDCKKRMFNIYLNHHAVYGVETVCFAIANSLFTAGIQNSPSLGRHFSI